MNARLVPTVGVLLLCLSPLHGQELRSLNRTIKKEPATTTAAPGYALLVFGAKADSSAWMVRDGDVLYFDRNGNGD